ncbi:unnamed protein product [Protopolystoma xenopodis]|uniref:Uncharacterized protein n=1 Tax=Protopolystoma xenopodis TaxID=117903 RepID=A0A3S5C853_9PLAT|nr:unnamed protein product [Protopolystoma xenopodis]
MVFFRFRCGQFTHSASFYASLHRQEVNSLSTLPQPTLNRSRLLLLSTKKCHISCCKRLADCVSVLGASSGTDVMAGVE